MDDLREVRRSDFFLAFSNKHKVNREFAASSFECMEGSEERALRPFSIYSAPTDNNLAESRPVDKSGIKGRRRPLGRANLFDVVHEVDADGARGSRIKSGKDSGMTVCWNFSYLIEASIAQKIYLQIATLGHAAVFGSDRRLFDPILDSLYGFVVLLFNFRLKRL